MQRKENRMKGNYYAKVIIREFSCTGSWLHAEELLEFSLKQVSGLKLKKFGSKHQSFFDEIFDKSFQLIDLCYAIA